MRKILLSMMVTLDGYYAGSNDEIDWHTVGDEFNDYAIAMLDSLDTLIFGRATYVGMASYWPTPTALKNDPIVAGKMNDLSKIVFSRTLEKVEWQNSRLVKEVNPQDILKMKQQPGKDMAIFGSGDLVTTFAQMGLIDDYRILINPVALGSGKPLFQGIQDRLHLKLIGTKTFKTGLVLLQYQPA
jgi:dihydrofolate reductase